MEKEKKARIVMDVDESIKAEIEEKAKRSASTAIVAQVLRFRRERRLRENVASARLTP